MNPTEQWPSAEQLAAIAAAAESLADAIFRNVRTSHPQSPARLPGFSEDDGAVHEALWRLDLFFHGRTREEAEMDFLSRWRWFEQEQAGPVSPNLDGMARFHDWQMALPSTLGPLDPPRIRQRIEERPNDLRILGVWPLGWPQPAAVSLERLWRVFRGLKVHFGQTPVFAVNRWCRTPDGWRREVERVPEADCPPARGSTPDGLPASWLESPRTFAADLRAALRAATGELLAIEAEAARRGVDLATSPQIKKAEANVKARDYLARHAKARRVTARELAKAIPCSAGLVSKLPAWKAYQEGLRKAKPSAPKAVSLTDGLLAVEGEEDAELERLIAEQEAEAKADIRQPRRRPRI